MKKTYVLEGLDCANCAAKIENEVRKISGVTTVSVNFMTTKMVIEAEEALMDEVEKGAINVVKKVEPDVSVRRI